MKINGKQTVKLRSGSIKFKNYFRQLAVPFKIYADFESLLKEVHTLKNTRNTFLAVLPIKVFVLMIDLVSQLFFTGEKNAISRFIEAILEEYGYCKKVIKKHFNKNLVISAEDEQRFQSSNKCWTCDELFNVGDNNVRDHCHMTGKYRGSAHWSCNINLKLTKKVPVLFHKLKGYDSHLIMEEIGKFDVKVNVIPNGFEKYLAFTINNNLVFIDSTRFMNSSLATLVKNLSNNDFKY